MSLKDAVENNTNDIKDGVRKYIDDTDIGQDSHLLKSTNEKIRIEEVLNKKQKENMNSLQAKLETSKGYILIELLCIFLFLLIFYSIFILLNFNKLFSLLLATLLFCSPSIAVLTKLDSIPEIYTFAQHFYNLRFPRPLVANIYLYLFIYLIIFINEEKVFNKKNGLYLGVIMGLSFSSFFNIFIFQAIALSFLLFCNFKKKIIYNLFKNYEFILYISFSFLFIATPFLLLINNAEPNYIERVQVININLEQKIFLLNHYLEKLVRIKMIIFYAFLALIFIAVFSCSDETSDTDNNNNNQNNNQFDGDVLLTTQQEVDEFGANEYSIINGNIEIRNFGTFSKKINKEKYVRNPKTNEKIFKVASNKIHFKIGKILHQRINKDIHFNNE